ncbi:hypothetical protein G7Y89_g13189 [Cudoniella acicularis]|uniref:Uncharacterized protein n=1 Tax=Cudoniella acicularis TaxID=354080 RepID=A0A8H4R8R2_9HELO|nr:hypothetical protein G7Y89_g13189 [Cudoniella acicularis]
MQESHLDLSLSTGEVFFSGTITFWDLGGATTKATYTYEMDDDSESEIFNNKVASSFKMRLLVQDVEWYLSIFAALTQKHGFGTIMHPSFNDTISTNVVRINVMNGSYTALIDQNMFILLPKTFRGERDREIPREGTWIIVMKVPRVQQPLDNTRDVNNPAAGTSATTKTSIADLKAIPIPSINAISASKPSKSSGANTKMHFHKVIFALTACVLGFTIAAPVEAPVEEYDWDSALSVIRPNADGVNEVVRVF